MSDTTENQSETTPSITGAQLCDDMDAIPSAREQSEHDLPMIVWLQGDEPYCEDFCIDAEAAMTALGIKRSRLTQISGKELRVGRIRIDRYVRPVYRLVDIDSYKKWTRATATHIRSSNLIEGAAEKLEQRADTIESRLQTTVNELHKNVEALVGEIAEETYRLQKVGLEKIEHGLHRSEELIGESNSQFAESILVALEELREGIPQLSLEDLDEAFSTVQKPILELHEQMQSLSEFTNKLTKVLAPIEDLRDNIIGDLEEITPALSEIYTLLFDSAASTKESLENQARFNRGIAEALGKVIECQREATLKQQAMLVSVLGNRGKSLVKAPARQRHLRGRFLK